MQRPSTPDDRFQTDLHVCYEILLYLSSRMAKLPAGAVLEFVTGDPGAEDEIRPWCELHEYTLLSAERLPGNRKRFFIRK